MMNLDVQLDWERRLAIAELLAQPDPPELPRRSHRVRVHGKPDRYALVAQVSAVFVHRKLLALEERRGMNVERVRCNIVWGQCPAFQKELAA